MLILPSSCLTMIRIASSGIYDLPAPYSSYIYDVSLCNTMLSVLRDSVFRLARIGSIVTKAQELGLKDHQKPPKIKVS